MIFTFLYCLPMHSFFSQIYPKEHWESSIHPTVASGSRKTNYDINKQNKNMILHRVK